MSSGRLRRHAFDVLFGTLGALVLSFDGWGCAGSDDSGATRVCAPGETLGCFVDSRGTRGVQVCIPDGTGYTACQGEPMQDAPAAPVQPSAAPAAPTPAVKPPDPPAVKPAPPAPASCECLVHFEQRGVCTPRIEGSELTAACLLACLDVFPSGPAFNVAAQLEQAWFFDEVRGRRTSNSAAGCASSPVATERDVEQPFPPEPAYPGCVCSLHFDCDVTVQNVETGCGR